MLLFLFQVAVLEDKLRQINTAEKPYEDDKESKIIKNAEEVARWDERKKWQKKMEEARQRLKEADLEVSKLSKQNTSLRDTVARQEREKVLLLINSFSSHYYFWSCRPDAARGQVEESPQGRSGQDNGARREAGAASG